MEIKILRLLCLIISIFFTSILYASESKKPLIAVGTFVSKLPGSQQIPLMAVSHSQGNKWAYFPTLPDGFIDRGKFDAVDCNDNYCVTVGSYYDKTHALPLVAITSDRGHTWSYVSTQPPDYQKNVNYGSANTTCTSSFCIIVSSYTNINNKHYPLLGISQDGKTWEYPKSIISNLPKDQFNSGLFSEVSCNNRVCIAVGYYSNKQEKLHPLIAYSANQGKDWFYSQIPIELQDREGVLNNVKCTDKSCVTSGWFIDKHKNKPLVLTSLDGGISWFYSIKELTGAQEMQLYSMNCDDNMCIAVGYYNYYFPLLVLSNDNGITWNYPSSVLNLPEKYKAYDNFLHTVSCNGNICMAGGIAGGSDFPLLIVSKDRGTTWAYIDTNLPSDFLGEIDFRTIHCQQDYCMTTGSYLSKDEKTYPLLGISQNAGVSWKFPSTIISELPKNIDWGAFHSHTSSSPIKSENNIIRKRDINSLIQ